MSSLTQAECPAAPIPSPRFRWPVRTDRHRFPDEAPPAIDSRGLVKMAADRYRHAERALERVRAARPENEGDHLGRGFPEWARLMMVAERSRDQVAMDLCDALLSHAGSLGFEDLDMAGFEPLGMVVDGMLYTVSYDINAIGELALASTPAGRIIGLEEIGGRS